jgi:hypothetical protein
MVLLAMLKLLFMTNVRTRASTPNLGGYVHICNKGECLVTD